LAAGVQRVVLVRRERLAGRQGHDRMRAVAAVERLGQQRAVEVVVVREGRIWPE